MIDSIWPLDVFAALGKLVAAGMMVGFYLIGRRNGARKERKTSSLAIEVPRNTVVSTQQTLKDAESFILRQADIINTLREENAGHIETIRTLREHRNKRAREIRAEKRRAGKGA